VGLIDRAGIGFVDMGGSMGVPALVGHAESGYVASVRCLVAAGFSEVGHDEYGLVSKLSVTDT
jgi:hypothetical protein